MNAPAEILDRQRAYVRQVVDTVNDLDNVLYEMFNEGEWYDREQRQRHEQHFLRFFRARCSNLLLSNSDHIAGDDPHLDPKLDVVTLHPKDWIGHFPVFERGFHKSPPKPYLYSEPVPEFDGETPSLDEVRRSVWETALAGAGWVNQNDPSFGWDRHTAIAVRAAARDSAYDVAGHCARFFNSGQMRFWEMEPNGKLASTGVCLANPGRQYVVYSAKGGSFTVDLSAAPNATLSVQWYNPRSGRYHAAGEIVAGDTTMEFTPPFPGDAVLRVFRNR